MAVTKVVFFSGAGISRDSGLKTFRDEDGLWNGFRVEDVCTSAAWENTPQQVLDFYNMRRREVRAAQPNAAHKAIAAMESDEFEVTVVTQNVDNLHEVAGSTNVIHLHGEIMKARPESDLDCISTIDWKDDITLSDQVGGTQLRPHVVFFTEGLPEKEFWSAAIAIQNADVLVVVGTTLEVYPAAGLAIRNYAPTLYLVDPNPSENMKDKLTSYGRTPIIVAKGASQGIPEVIAEIQKAFRKDTLEVESEEVSDLTSDDDQST